MINQTNNLQTHVCGPIRSCKVSRREYCMWFRMFKCTLVLALTLSLGLHWALMQTVAWTGMIISYSRDGSFTEAVSKTFDGQHPCCLCKVIQKGRAEEKKQEGQPVKPGSKLELGLVWSCSAFDFACEQERIPSFDLDAVSRREEPPKPRPRASYDSLA
ncbi:MAG: hypothetical protein HOP33_20615 [Verrucomicrobia bacterium]|nr:hypothetical protein [Verrucomicrobiota bacterium]